MKVKPYIRVYHHRDENNAYTGHTTCIVSYIDPKRGISTSVGESFANPNEKRPITKKDGYRIATERAFKNVLYRVEK